MSILFGNTYEAKDLLQIAETYDDYCPTESNVHTRYWARNWERLIDAKCDFDIALKSLSPRKQRFMRLIIGGKGEITNRELEVRGFYEPNKFKWQIAKEMANYLNKRG